LKKDKTVRKKSDEKRALQKGIERNQKCRAVGGKGRKKRPIREEIVCVLWGKEKRLFSNQGHVC